MGRSRGRAHCHGWAAAAHRDRPCRVRIRARASRGFPIIWGGYFPTLYPDGRAQSNDYVDYAVRGQGEDSAAASCSRRCLRTRDDVLRADRRALSFARTAGVHNGAGGRFATASLRRCRCRMSGSTDPRRYLVPHVSRRTHGRRTRPSLGCRFRCTFCGVAAMFRGGTALPAAERLERGAAGLVRDRRRFDPVLRPQLLRSRSRHGAAARGAGDATSCPGGVTRAPTRCSDLSAHPGRSSDAAACAWPTSAPSRPATRCCKRSARAHAPTRRWRWRSCAGATA